MINPVPLEELLRWRQTQAEAAAPPPPRAARLLALTSPWWEISPTEFKGLVQRLASLQLVFGHAMEERRAPGSGQPISSLIFSAAGEQEAMAHLLYFSVRDRHLRLRFQLETAPALGETDLEVTFVSMVTRTALFAAEATQSVEKEYRLDAELAPELADAWSGLRVTDSMPFQLILRPVAAGA